MASSVLKSSNTQLHKSDIFSLGLVALFCLDPIEFEKNQKNLNIDEKALESYLDDFRARCPKNHFFYILKCMLSYSPSTRPSIDQIFQDFSHLETSQTHYLRNLPFSLPQVYKKIYFMNSFYIIQ